MNRPTVFTNFRGRHHVADFLVALGLNLISPGGANSSRRKRGKLELTKSFLRYLSVVLHKIEALDPADMSNISKSRLHVENLWRNYRRISSNESSG